MNCPGGSICFVRRLVQLGANLGHHGAVTRGCVDGQLQDNTGSLPQRGIYLCRRFLAGGNYIEMQSNHIFAQIQVEARIRKASFLE